MRYRAVISYFGAPYVGWQKQLNGISVQEVLEKALFQVFGKITPTVASGRTDAGVHAEGQVVHFDAVTSIPTDKIPFAVNAELPRDISMLFCEVVDDNFSARFSAKRKTYCYRLYLSQHIRPLLEQTHAHIMQPLDVTAMCAAARIMEGEHDFKCFEATGSARENTVRTLYSVAVECRPLAFSTSNVIADQKKVFDAEVEIFVTGNGFLYNMVRIIAGTLVYVGLGKLTPQDIADILNCGDRTKAGKTLPPEGLSLIKVEY
ncbi:MAG: tRNA pseudouridine(38-40) synthase TruA [Clostridia bacterium]